MKYELTENKKNGLTQIRALVDIPRYSVPKGDLGGWIKKTENLSQTGDCWVFGDAEVYGDARVCANAAVEKTSDVLTISSMGGNCRTITYTVSNNKVSCGCFLGTLDEFKEAVDKKYKGAGSYYAGISCIEAYVKQIKNRKL